MNAILKLGDKFFVYVEGLSDEVKNDPTCIIDCSYAMEADFYDGRVRFSGSHLSIDNIDVYDVDGYLQNGTYLKTTLPPRTIVAYLNQIAARGIKAFLENYKKALLEFMEVFSKLVASEDENHKKRWINDTLSLASFLIFKISMHVDISSFYYDHKEAYQNSIAIRR